MKIIYFSVAMVVLVFFNYYNVYAQTNTTLSNLQSPTAINQSLLPNGNKVHDLGSPALYWKDLYTDRLFLRGQLVIHTPGNQNLFFGSAGITSLAGQLNTGLGYLTLRSLTTGSFNTATGVEALFSTNTGRNNTANGYRSLYTNTSGDYNTAMGYQSLYLNTTGYSNTAMGFRALHSNTTGYNNTAIGERSLSSNTIGYANTGIGLAALSLNASGKNNVAVGYAAMAFNDGGSRNTALGSSALNSNTSGFDNVAVGAEALRDNLTGHRNTAVGEEAMMLSKESVYNVAVGYRSMYSNNTGSQNTATGYLALFANYDGQSNVATGAGALAANINGSTNTANGYYALNSNTSGNYNTADGSHAMYANTTGSFNAAYGSAAFLNSLSGISNTVIGSSALSNMTRSNINTAIGADAWMSNNISNAVAIGYGSAVYASHQARIGNTATTSIGGQVSWTTFSDGRFKQNVQENITGLAFINKLRPVSYNLNLPALSDYEKRFNKRSPDSLPQEVRSILEQAQSEASAIVYDGFIAQEVETAAREVNFNFSGVDKPKTEDGLYGLRYDHFVVPLVKAVQELSRMNDTLRNENENLRKEMNELKALVQVIASGKNQPLSSSTKLSNDNNTQKIILTTASLDQNIPNPFTSTTTIPYTLPQQYRSARIIITSQQGKTLKQVNLSGIGKGTVNIDARTLASGAYNYSLVIDDQAISTRKMLSNK